MQSLLTHTNPVFGQFLTAQKHIYTHIQGKTVLPPGRSIQFTGRRGEEEGMLKERSGRQDSPLLKSTER